MPFSHPICPSYIYLYNPYSQGDLDFNKCKLHVSTTPLRPFVCLSPLSVFPPALPRDLQSAHVFCGHNVALKLLNRQMKQPSMPLLSVLAMSSNPPANPQKRSYNYRRPDNPTCSQLHQTQERTIGGWWVTIGWWQNVGGSLLVAIGWWQLPGGNGLVAIGWWQSVLVGGNWLMTTG